MTKSKIFIAAMLSAFAVASFAQTPAADEPASSAKHMKHKKHSKHAMGAASSASSSMK